MLWEVSQDWERGESLGDLDFDGWSCRCVCGLSCVVLKFIGSNGSLIAGVLIGLLLN